jgi:hypothetical protein
MKRLAGPVRDRFGKRRAHRVFDIDGPTPDRAFSIDPRPADGKPGTVRIAVRDTRFQDRKGLDLYRLWIDPGRTHLAMRAETAVFDSNGPRDKRGLPTKLAYLDTKILTDLDRSPSGFWYPTRVVRKVSGGSHDQVTRLLLNFRAEIPDSLFQPPR